MLVDFHCHSSRSDGYYPPEQLAARLAAAGVQWAALTDHCTLAGQARFRQELQRHGVGWVSGVELHVEIAAGALHLLAYGFDLADHGLRRALRMVADPWLAPLHSCLERARHGSSRLLRPRRYAHVAPHAVALKAVAHHGLRLQHALRIVHHAGGRVFLAHPLAGWEDQPEDGFEALVAMLPELQEAGLDGLEVEYKAYPSAWRRQLASLAASHGLLMSGGSDYHGPSLPGSSQPGIDLPEASALHMVQGLQKG